MDLPLTDYQLDLALGEASEAGSPDAVVGELLAAAQEPDKMDGVTPTRVLITAAESLARFGRHDEAVDVARRAAESGSDEVLNPRAWLGKALVDAGRLEEGRATFREVRRESPKDWTTYHLAGETFEVAGDLPQAVAWFTSGGQRAFEYGEREHAFLLLQGRRRVREAMGFAEDGLDQWARETHEQIFGQRKSGTPASGDAAATASGDASAAPAASAASANEDEQPYGMLWWPQHEHARLVGRWPDLARHYEGDWEAHRVTTEHRMRRLAKAGHTGLRLIAGSVDELEEQAKRTGHSPAEAGTLQACAEEATRGGRTQAWPPERNDRCWCGSGSKYKKCCGGVAAPGSAG